MISKEFVKKYEREPSGKLLHIHRYFLIEGDSPQELIDFGMRYGMTEKEVRERLKYSPQPHFKMNKKPMRDLMKDENIKG